MKPWRRRRAPFALTALLLGAAAADADWTVIFPRPIDNDIYLDLYGISEKETYEGVGQPADWRDRFFKERLSLESAGYWYDPRFLQYGLKAGFSLKQESYESSTRDPLGWRRATGWDGDFRLYLLPEHPYNLMLFATRYEPVSREQFADQRNSVESTRGATFRYRRRPWFFHASYLDDDVEGPSLSTTVRKVSVDGQYFRQLAHEHTLSFTADGARSLYDNRSGQQGTLDEGHAGNLLDLGRLRLSSDVTATSGRRDAGLQSDDTTDQLLWRELFNMRLPWHLRVEAAYRYQDASSDVGSGLAARSYSDTGSNVELHLVHRLYESLDSTYTFLRDSHRSSGGSSTSTTHALDFNYSKSIPRGMILAGLSMGRGRTDNRGRGTDIVGELHSGIAVPTGTFTLSQRNVREDSISIFLKSPLAPYEDVLLTRDVHYVVRPLASEATFEIQILTLPSRFALPGTYDFKASYELAGGDFDLGSHYLSANVSVQLVDNMLTPYASYSSVRSEVVAGLFPGDPIDTDTATAGLRFRRLPFTVVGEYQLVDAVVEPYEAWSLDAQVVGSWKDTSVYGSALVVTRHYLDDLFALYGAGGRTEQRQSISGSLRQQLFDRTLALSLGGSYSRITGIEEARAVSGDFALSWRVAKIDVTAGATVYFAQAQGYTLATTRRDHTTYFVRLRRKIF